MPIKNEDENHGKDDQTNISSPCDESDTLTDATLTEKANEITKMEIGTDKWFEICMKEAVNKQAKEQIRIKRVKEIEKSNENSKHSKKPPTPPTSPKEKQQMPLSFKKLQRSQSMPNDNNKAANQLIGLQKSPSRPVFSSSTFYDPQQHPTLEEQVKLCREIAKQLVSDKANEKSKGREMFERRVQKSFGWITTENEDSFQNFNSSGEDFHERTITDGPPNLKLLLDPRHVDDINTVQGVNEHIIVTQETKTRDTCKSIVNDLMSPEENPNRGNVLFAKRVQKSNEWIVDDIADQLNKQSASNPSASQWSAYSSPIPSTDSVTIVPNQQATFKPSSSFSPASYTVSFSFGSPQQIRSNSSNYKNQQQQQRQFFNSHKNLNFSHSPTPTSLSRPSSSLSSASMLLSQFKDFNPRPKPFCRAY